MYTDAYTQASAMIAYGMKLGRKVDFRVQLNVDNLGPKDRSFAYVAAAWLSGVDDEVDPKEEDKLHEVRDLLGIDLDRAAELEKIARDLKPHEGAWAHDLVALFKAIPVRLEVSTEDELEVAFE